jgi:hypothetical protein
MKSGPAKEADAKQPHRNGCFVTRFEPPFVAFLLAVSVGCVVAVGRWFHGPPITPLDVN